MSSNCLRPARNKLCLHLERGQARVLQTSREKSEQFKKECLQVLLKLAYVLKKLVRVLQEVARMLTEVGPSMSPNDVRSGLLIDGAGARGASLPSCPINIPCRNVSGNG